MDSRNSRYDSDLGMFVEPFHDPNMTRLRFLRWLAERGLLEHRPAGAPSGELVARSAVADSQVDVRKAA